MAAQSMDSIVSLCKRRGFIFPGSAVYGGLANSWDYGPLGVELKNNVKRAWWRSVVYERDDIVGLDSCVILAREVWETSGHVATFTDPLTECTSCHKRFRADQLDGPKCPECGGELTEARQFNLMFRTFMGPVEDTASTIYPSNSSSARRRADRSPRRSPCLRKSRSSGR